MRNPKISKAGSSERVDSALRSLAAVSASAMDWRFQAGPSVAVFHRNDLSR
eukprot:m.6609 g.6609  ORF g.6609 m.6609 type:complete len:51 (+) comp3864_c0_seq1:655-807(+)